MVAQQPSYLSHKQILVVGTGLMAGMLLAVLNQSIVGIALPRITGELGGIDKLSWVVTANLLASTAVMPLWGKISDLFGRRQIFQAAIVIFVLGSLLSGLAQSMTQLVAFRALQGIGAGGLFAVAQAVIGEVIPARQRGRYQGYFSAVWGVSSIAGPLLGGLVTDGPGWRWIFWYNVPIGIAALVVTSYALRIPTIRREHKIDYLGATAIVAAASCVLLYLSWRGRAYGWTEGWALGLLAAGVVLAVAFVLIESRAAEPIIPLHLFGNSIFSLGNVFGFLSGLAMVGTMIYLPLYLQAVKGMSATVSGLAMLPAVVGTFASSIGSGQLITRTGRYKIYPILGAAMLVTAQWLLSSLNADSPMWQIGLYEFLFGLGIGLTMQTVTTAIQNSVLFRDLGTATSSTVFFRQLGGAFGAAVFGAILAARLESFLAEALPRQVLARIPPGATENVEAIHQLPPALQVQVIDAFANALHDVFLVGVPFSVVALAAALFIREIPLATGHPPDSQADADAGGGTPEREANPQQP